MAPWWINTGTRFLIPALAFASLAMFAVLPRGLAWVAVVVQMALAWPGVVELWTQAGAWRLRGVPWRAALRVEPEPAYLHRVVPEYRVAEMVRANTRRGDRILDLETGAAWAYFEATPLVPWQSAAADRAAACLRVGAVADATAFWEGTVRWSRQPLLAVRARLVDEGAPGPWRVQELAVLDSGKTLRPRDSWEAEARPNSWEAPLAFDGNLVSHWQTWRPASPGMFVGLHFPKPLDLEGARVVLFQPQQGTVVAVDGLTVEGTMWKTLAEVPWGSMPWLNHRRTAMRAVQREGFRYILTRSSDEGLGQIGRDLVDRPTDWGLAQIGAAEGVFLLRIE
jgi:hypothetical protein